MKAAHGLLTFSAVDLSNHLACPHLTALDLASFEGGLRPPPGGAIDDLLVERGLQHEAAYLSHLESQGLSVQRLGIDATADDVREVMRTGADVIYQAPLAAGIWQGRADFLRRVERPSAFGAWSYEAYDTKLARETRGGTLLQLCLYSDLLRDLQGELPELMHVVPPGADFVPESHRVREYMAYFRLAQRRFEMATSAAGDIEKAPEPVSHCEACRWAPRCEAERRDVDHLSYVAGITRQQRVELGDRSVHTLADLASHPVPLEWKPRRGAAESYVRVREQARVQLEGRVRRQPVHELLPIEPGRGLAKLPPPSPGDLFLDLEGDPFVANGGLEYLFGIAFANEPYGYRWALDRASERSAFEQVVDLMVERWERDPAMHVYHFAPYEPAALKRLMGRHATRETEIDRMLRGGVFVDLYAVVRGALRASVESYSIKHLESFYGFERQEDLERSGHCRQVVERAVEVGPRTLVTDAVRESVENYNREDCESTRHLRDWLESIRAGVEADSEVVPRPTSEPPDAADHVKERDVRVAALMASLVAGVPEDPAARSEEQRARWTLAHLLDFHRREDKVVWWDYFRLRDMDHEELMGEPKAIAGLEYASTEGGTKKTPIHRYRFPQQEVSIRKGKLKTSDGIEIGSVEAIDLVARTLDIKKVGKHAGVHPSGVFAFDFFNKGVIADALFRLGEWVASHGVDADGGHRAARDLLMQKPPRLRGDALSAADAGADTVRLACDLALRLDGGVLPIQGPPGSGKTYTGARMIVELVRAGKKVGVCATSHKVIRHLLEGVVDAGGDAAAIACAHKVTHLSDATVGAVIEIDDNAAALAAMAGGEAHVLGGTSWLWARPEFAGAVDVLFVDEAGQMSLADVLAIAQAAGSIVLIGDPQQLEQPVQGSHPPGTEVSALVHLLGGARTVAADRGLFLRQTRRLAPALCAFTSEVFYEGRLESMPGLECQELLGETRFLGAGLWFVPVPHEGNRNASREEVDAVGELVLGLTSGNVRWIDHKRRERVLTLADVLVVAPYNAQVADLSDRLPDARVGTVDKFQGQEAAIVVYSMATSSALDAPRGMEFLYDLNRLNVATSRARCAAIIVGSPRIFEPECQTPMQMRLANGMCRFLELARQG